MNTQIHKDGRERLEGFNISERKTEQRVVVSTIKRSQLHLGCRATETRVPSLFDYKLLDERGKRRKHRRFCWRM